jgi:hypothetical protein
MTTDPVTQQECSERNAASMLWGRETAERITNELNELSKLTASLSSNTERLSWVISDPDVGLVSQVRQLALVVTNLKETQWQHSTRLDFLDQCAKDMKEARKPWQQMGISLLEKLIWLGLTGALAWLLALQTIKP